MLNGSFRLVLTTQDESARQDVQRIVTAVEQICLDEFKAMAATRPEAGSQRHLAVLSSGLVTMLDRLFTQMYAAVGVERTETERQAFGDKINNLVVQETQYLAAKYRGEMN